MAARNTTSDDPLPAADTGTGTEKVLINHQPPLLTRVVNGSLMYGVKGLMSPILWYRGWKEYFYPPDDRPNIVKTYDCRPHLPARIFFPSSYDQTSLRTLPTVFSIHGGGFCIGEARDDDAWNRAFADSQDILVISIEYSLAPWYPFPTGLHDVEAIILAVLADESLPLARANPSASTASLGSAIAHSRTAVLGFSAGANLALTVTQLPSIRDHADAPRAAVSVYARVDFTGAPHAIIATRPYKPTLPPPRNSLSDYLLPFGPYFDWSYIPYGTDVRDPLLSPAFASPDALPPFVFLIGAELDMLAHESWRMACSLRRKGGDKTALPDRDSKDVQRRVCGRPEPAAQPRVLELNDERFAFEETWDDGSGGVKWLLVPDVVHGFDNRHLRDMQGGEESIKDAEAKTVACMDEIGRWLKKTVWQTEG